MSNTVKWDETTTKLYKEVITWFPEDTLKRNHMSLVEVLNKYLDLSHDDNRLHIASIYQRQDNNAIVIKIGFKYKLLYTKDFMKWIKDNPVLREWIDISCSALNEDAIDYVYLDFKNKEDVMAFEAACKLYK